MEVPSEDDEGEILLVSVDIGDGRRDVIRVYENDDAEKLAMAFA